MAFTEFSLESVERDLRVKIQQDSLFAGLAPVAVPAWLQELLARGMQLALLSEKARSEFIVAPILLAARELSGDAFAIYSGQRLDVDPEHGLVGECDYILAATPPVPLLRAPLATIVEAKKNDIEAGLGQCLAQNSCGPYLQRAGGPGSGTAVRLRDHGGSMAVPAAGRRGGRD